MSVMDFKLIAEFCQNHNGDLKILHQMIAAAAEGGATHAKIQTIFADDLSFRAEFEGDNGTESHSIVRPYKAEYERLKALELTYEQHELFVKQCKAAGLVPLTTAFNLTCIPEIRTLGWKSVKVASYDCGSLPLIDALSDYFDEIIVSTGASYDWEIENTAKTLTSKNKKFTLMHCVTIYPTPLEQMHLNRISYLKRFSNSVGLSNHSLTSRDDVKADLVAIHLGAEAIERHFTILPPDATRDGKISIDKNQLRQIIDFSKMDHISQIDYLAVHVPDYSNMLGSISRSLSTDELLNRDYYRGRFCNKLGDKQIFNWEDNARKKIGI